MELSVLLHDEIEEMIEIFKHNEVLRKAYHCIGLW
jgi:hypothetical protein